MTDIEKELNDRSYKSLLRSVVVAILLTVAFSLYCALLAVAPRQKTRPRIGTYILNGSTETILQRPASIFTKKGLTFPLRWSRIGSQGLLTPR